MFLGQVEQSLEEAAPPRRTVFDMKLAELNVAADDDQLVDA